VKTFIIDSDSIGKLVASKPNQIKYLVLKGLKA